MRKTTYSCKHVCQQDHPNRAEQLNGGWSSRNRRIKARFSGPVGPTSEEKAAATTTVGSTNGIVVSERRSDLAGNS